MEYIVLVILGAVIVLISFLAFKLRQQRKDDIAFRAMQDVRQERLDRINRAFEEDRKRKPYIKLSSPAASKTPKELK